jgi:hypothetical protein
MNAPKQAPEQANQKANDDAKKGCASSFLSLQRGELSTPCGSGEPNPEEQYVPSDKEREAGGEG